MCEISRPVPYSNLCLNRRVRKVFFFFWSMIACAKCYQRPVWSKMLKKSILGLREGMERYEMVAFV